MLFYGFWGVGFDEQTLDVKSSAKEIKGRFEKRDVQSTESSFVCDFDIMLPSTWQLVYRYLTIGISLLFSFFFL